VVAFFGCSESAVSPAAPPTPAAVTATATTPLSGVVGSTVTPPPAVTVSDSVGKPVAGVAVQFAVVDGGGSATGLTQVTNSAGVATVGEWKLGPHTGNNALSAGVAGALPATITVLSVPGAVAKLTLVTGDAQTDTTRAVLRAPLTVRATDAYDNPVRGIVVQFGLTQGTGTLSTPSPTDSLGQASAILTLGDSSGTYVVQAALAGLQGTAISFTGVITLPPYRATAISMGEAHTCAISLTQQMDCWGNNQHGELGDGTTTRRLTRVAVAGGLPFSSVSTSGTFSCGIASGTTYCWGDNTNAALGDGTTTDRFVPTPVTGDVAFTALSVGADHSCALTSAGAAYCWGLSQVGAVGDGTNANSRPTPVAVAGGLRFNKLASGYQHSCGIATSGVTYCWGRNSNGELGDGTTTDRNAPTIVSGGIAFTTLAAGASDTCGITADGDAYCWGSNVQGQLGIGNRIDQLAPARVAGGYAFAKLSAGSGVVCGITTTGSLYCWGADIKTGGGSSSDLSIIAPRRVIAPAGAVFTAVTAGDTGGCALATNSFVYCWGVNTSGEVGDGTTMYRLTLVPVVQQ
jgi:alpha-tubulin suppressor-like RCC1 family protein